jgi:hypothetical protein
MNPALHNLYEEANEKLNRFDEPIRFDKEILKKKFVFPQQYCRIGDYTSIFEIIKKKMRQYGVELIITSVNKPMIEKKTVQACYVQVRCAFSKHVSDEIRMEQRMKDGLGGESVCRLSVFEDIGRVY